MKGFVFYLNHSAAFTSSSLVGSATKLGSSLYGWCHICLLRLTLIAAVARASDRHSSWTRVSAVAEPVLSFVVSHSSRFQERTVLLSGLPLRPKEISIVQMDQPQWHSPLLIEMPLAVKPSALKASSWALDFRLEGDQSPLEGEQHPQRPWGALVSAQWTSLFPTADREPNSVRDPLWVWERTALLQIRPRLPSKFYGSLCLRWAFNVWSTCYQAAQC